MAAKENQSKYVTSNRRCAGDAHTDNSAYVTPNMRANDNTIADISNKHQMAHSPTGNVLRRIILLMETV
ncbi:hypothetical protein EVAR_63466_1 [Eumeta japonica]|uniref:Uncharacterized protein n=1 Tax=Eumeta variegata TaxID=151549 RepID=A0A4C1YEY7_EUMVA|nr:hypothetical protein EVAR_63466_1 [Eumeta japonica]